VIAGLDGVRSFLEWDAVEGDSPVDAVSDIKTIALSLSRVV
jgi:hypothetical protein